MKKVESLWIYPIKSCGGFEVSQVVLTSCGPFRDRTFMLIDENGLFISQRTDPLLCLVQTRIEGNYLIASAPSLGEVSMSLNYFGTRVSARVHDDTCVAFECEARAHPFFKDLLGKPCTLVRQLQTDPRMHDSTSLGKKISVSFADAYPLLIISAESLVDLNRRIGSPEIIDMERFRPNIVVSGCKAYEEDTWLKIEIGPLKAPLRFAKKCSRCEIPEINPKTGKHGREPTRTLARYRRDRTSGKIYFGSNYVNESTGIIHFGDEVIVFSPQ